MSFTVTTTPLQLPDFGETVLLVNNGNDTVFVGPRRDILPSDGFPLPPLGQVTLSSGQIYYAQANSGQQELDALAGALAFSPSPAQIAAQLVGSTLASVIATDIAASALPANTAAQQYATGSRLSDASGLVVTATLNPFTGSSTWGLANNGTSWINNGYGYIDARNFHSYVLSVTCTTNCAFTIYTLDNNNAILFSRSYEGIANQTIVVSDNLAGPFIALSFTNLIASGAILSIEYRLSNRVLSGETIDFVTSSGPDTMMLLSATGTVAAGANSVTMSVPPINGHYAISLGLGFAAQLKYFYGSLNGGQQRLLAYTPAPQNIYIELAATRAPLYFLLHSTETTVSSTFGIMVTRAKGS